MRKNSKSSPVWNFFQKVEGGAQCQECSKVVTCFGNTSNLVKHLRRVHKYDFSSGTVHRQVNHVDTGNREGTQILTENESSDLNLNMAPSQETIQDNSVDFSFYTNGEGAAAPEEEHNEHISETGTAVHTIQAYRDVNGTTFLYLQPAPEGEVQIQNATFQPVVATSETITSNGEIVSVAVQQKEPPPQEGQAVEGEPKPQEEAAPRRVVHAPVKNSQGSTIGSRTVVRQLARPSPMKTTSSASSNCNNNNNNHNNNNNNNNGNKSDSFDAFGKYIASMLRNLPSKTAWKLQGEIVNWILKEQIKNNDC